MSEMEAVYKEVSGDGISFEWVPKLVELAAVVLLVMLVVILLAWVRWELPNWKVAIMGMIWLTGVLILRVLEVLNSKPRL